jgi:hypothetical protein
MEARDHLIFFSWCRKRNEPAAPRDRMIAYRCHMMRRPQIVFFLIVTCAMAALTSASAQQRASNWRFISDGYGTEVDFPADLFPLEVEASPYGQGRAFRTADGRAALWLYFQGNEVADDPRGFVERNLKTPRGTINYMRVTDRFFVVSGVHNDDVYYSRCNFSAARHMHCAYLVYPNSEARDWDGVVTRISLSLRIR